MTRTPISNDAQTPHRAYGSCQDMPAHERNLVDGHFDLVTIATSDANHYEITKAFLNAGFDSLCEKPMTMTVEEGEDIVAIVRDTCRICAVN